MSEMSKTAKREYIREKSRDYARALSRGEKHAIVQEVARTCAFSVKYVIRRLNAPSSAEASAGKRRGRPPLCTREDVAWLKRIWRESDFLCGKLLACAIPSILESLAREGVAVPARTRERLERISPATIDRLLRPSKTERPRRPRSGVLADLRKEIPVRALRASGCPEPGHLGVDTVALGGGSTSGEFFWILTVTDVYSGYTRIWPVWNRTSENVAEALRRLLPSLPFAPVELHSDNGSEFINSEVFRAVKSLFPRCSMDRSRPYHKNDNAHVEQKNGALVRGLFGELRLDEFSCREALERACELASLRHNHFIPSRKALRKTRDPLTGTTRTRYAKAATPAARLEAFEGLPESSRAVLREESAGTHFLELNRKLRVLLAEVVRTTCRRACGASADLGAAGAGASPSDSASPPPSGNPRPPLAKTSPESSLPGCTSL